MSVFRRKRSVRVAGKRKPVERRDTIYSYDFEIDGERYRGSTGLTDKADAEEWEAAEKKRIRRRNRGVAQDAPSQSMPIHDWAAEYLDIKAEREMVMGPIVAQLAVVLRFFGARPLPEPGVTIEDDAPYHDLTLVDVINDPYWIHRFDQWIRSRDVNWQTRNHYRSRVSDLYEVAGELAYRLRTGVMFNPFKGMHREKKRKTVRTVLTAEEVARWIAEAPAHARTALAIGMLAPKLRRASILALDFKKHIRYGTATFPRPRAIVVHEHKTDDDTGRPQVYPIVRQLARILIATWRRNQEAYPGSTGVVLYYGRQVKDIEESIRTAARAAGLTYGRYGGVTFHSLRHIASSLFAKMDTNAFKQLDLMGWTDLRTPLYYTHTDGESLRVEAERLSAQMPVAAAMASTLPPVWVKGGRKLAGELATQRPGSKRFLRAQRENEKGSKIERKRKNA